MQADGKSTLTSVSKWNSRKVNCPFKSDLLLHCFQYTFMVVQKISFGISEVKKFHLITSVCKPKILVDYYSL